MDDIAMHNDFFGLNQADWFLLLEHAWSQHILGTNTDQLNPVDTCDHCYLYPNQTVTIIMYLIRMTMDYLNFLRMKKMALAAILLWLLHQYHILRRHIYIF